MPNVLHGRDGSFGWLCCRDDRLSLGWLCRQVPDLVLGRYVAVTSLDSGPFRPGPDDIAAGWASTGEVAYSPRIADVHALPLAGWDEWYVFSSRPRLPPLDVFVNYSDFTPAMMDEESERSSGDADDEEVRRQTQGRTERFWAQLRTIDPLGFLADGTALTCVLQNDILFRKVLEAVENAAS